MNELSPIVADQVSVGTDAILESTHVTEGPGRIANAPVPSIFHDDRGEIHRLRVGGKRVNLLFSKAQVMRSGYLHPNTTHDFIISGKVEVWTLTDKGTEKTVYGSQEHFEVASYTPHILHFLEDTRILEWNEGEFRCWYYHPYRRIIDIRNSLVSKNTGTFSRLVPQDPTVDSQLSLSSGNKGGKIIWMFTGVLCGVVIGSLLNQRRR